LQDLKPGKTSTENIAELERACYDAMNDDLNSPVLIAQLFEASRIINSVNDGRASLTAGDLQKLKTLFKGFVFDVLGLQPAETGGSGGEAMERLMEYLLEIRARAKTERNFALSDEIRDRLLAAGIKVNDTKEGSTWKLA